MASPRKKPNYHSRNTPRANWLLRYLTVQQLYDKKVVTALQRAQYDAAQALKKLDGDNIGDRTKRYQVNLVRMEIREIIKGLFKGFVPIISAGQSDAAEAAARAALKQDAKVLKALFPDPNDRATWEKSFVETARNGVVAMLMRVTKSEIPLSQQVWKSSAWTNDRLNNIINSHLARNSSADELAKAVEKFVRHDAKGGVAYAAKRLARTEINNAFHAVSIHNAQQLPWVKEVEWHLSKSHPIDEDCMCEAYAARKLFPVDRVPLKPHPNCLCYIVPHQISQDDLASKLISGAFDHIYDEKYGRAS